MPTPRLARIPLLSLRLQTERLARQYASSMTAANEHKPARYDRTDPTLASKPLGEGKYIKTAGCLIIGSVATA